MRQAPFIYLHAQNGEHDVLHVPEGYEGFVSNGNGRLRLPAGVHPSPSGASGELFLVPVGGSHRLELKSLGGAMLRGNDGRWHPLRVMGQLAYSIVKPGLFVGFLERERIHAPLELELELSRVVTETAASFFDGEAWSAHKLEESLEFASGELLRHLGDVVAPLGLDLQSLELLPGSSAPERSDVRARPL